MELNCEICGFRGHPTKYQFLTTDRWIAGLIPNQAYLGRAIVSLREHKGSLSELDETDWAEFRDIVAKLEPAYQAAFGAVPLNWGCFMNNAFKAPGPKPHVHWHIFPRYNSPVTIAGLTFEDSHYGSFYDHTQQRLVDESVLDEIFAKLSAALAR